jgi:acyl dehydratase
MALREYETVRVGQPLEVGDPPGPLRVELTRADLVRYAGASGDFNPIHWDERFATAVGLPGVIAHGMLTMALGGRLLTGWAGDPGAVLEYDVRFSRPVVVPPDGPAVVTVSGKVGATLPERSVRVDLTAESGGRTVLGRAVAVVRLA